MASGSRREYLLNSVKDLTRCSEYFQKSKSEFGWNNWNFESRPCKNIVINVVEIIQELNEKQFNQLWKDTFQICVQTLEMLSRIITSEKRTTEDQTDKDEQNAYEALGVVSLLLLGSLKMEKPVATDEMYQCAELLHGSVFDLHEVKSFLGVAICKICAEWWKSKLMFRQKLCSNAITLLLRLYIGNSKKNFFDKVYSMYECLSLFDFKSQHAQVRRASVEAVANEDGYAQAVVQELRRLIIRSFHRMELRDCASGRKFLSFAFLLHEDLMKDIHLSLMESIHTKFSHTKAETIGQLYYQCWRSSEEQMKETFEEICVQDLMFRAAHSPCAANLDSFAPLRTIIMSFTNHKSSAEVRHMMSRLYGPILWRSLKAASSMVRANAGRLLSDAFPMEELRSTQSKTSDDGKFMQQQFEAFYNMLLDDCPKIRAIGCDIVADMLHTYWETTPAHIVSVVTQRMFGELTFDPVAEVRQAVFKATIVLLDTAFAPPLLAKLLPPCIKNSIHDVNEKVRIAAVEVLLALMNTTSISFSDLCPVENIMAQLEIDTLRVSRHLMKILSPSFVPKDEPVQEWVEKCVKFFKMNVNAARRFYTLVPKDLANQEIGEFLDILGHFTLNAASCKFRQEQSTRANSSDSLPLNDTSNVESAKFADLVIEDHVLPAVLDTSCILWRTFDQARSRELTKKIMITFSKSICVCFKIADDERMFNALVSLSSFLPPASIPTFSKSVIPKLRLLSDDAPLSYCEMLIKCVCCWGWTTQLLELLDEWICESVTVFNKVECDTQDKTKSKKPKTSACTRRSARQQSRKENEAQKSEAKGRKKKKAVTFNEKVQLVPGKALKYLKSFLHVQKDSSYAAFRKQSSRRTLNSIANNLAKCQEEITKRLCSSSKTDTAIWTGDFLVEAFTLRCRILTILHHTGKDEDEETTAGETSNVSEFVSIILWMPTLLSEQKCANQTLNNLKSSVLPDAATSENLVSRLYLYRKIFLASLQADLEFLLCGINVFSEVEEAVANFCQSDVNLTDYLSALVQIMLQLHEYAAFRVQSILSSNDNQAVNESNFIRYLPSIFDSCVTTILQLARKDPDHFIQVFRDDIRAHLKKLTKEIHIVNAAFPNIARSNNIMLEKLVSAIFADVFSEIKSCQHLLIFNKISELPVFSSSVLPVICSTKSETTYICENIICKIARTELLGDDKTKKMAQAVVVLLHVLLKGEIASSTISYKHLRTNCSIGRFL